MQTEAKTNQNVLKPLIELEYESVVFCVILLKKNPVKFWHYAPIQIITNFLGLYN